MSPSGQPGLAARIAANASRDVVVLALQGVVRHQLHRRHRQRRGIEQDQARRSESGGRERGDDHPAPRVAEDGQARPIKAGGPDPGGEIDRGLGESMPALPVLGQAVPGQVHRNDVPSCRGDGRPDAPERLRVRGHAMDEDKRRVGGVAPLGVDPRDPVALDDDATSARQVRHRGGHRGGHGRGQVGRRRAERRGEVQVGTGHVGIVAGSPRGRPRQSEAVG